VFPIPDGLSSESAAPMLCAGITTYSPLKRFGVKPGMRIAVVGVGGLGHFAILWAVAMGAEVWALSHTPNKKNDALKLGATHFIDTNQKDWHKQLGFTFNMILNSADATQHLDLPAYLSTLRANGEFHNVGIPDEPLPQIKAFDMVPNGCKIGASHLGNRPEMLEMLQLAADKRITPMIETVDISEQGCKKAVEGVACNSVRYRYALVNYDKAFPNRGS
jgi:alcohol dehydrogenase (NADP+)